MLSIGWHHNAYARCSMLGCVFFSIIFSFRVHVLFIPSFIVPLSLHPMFECLYFLCRWLHYDTLTAAIIIFMRLQIAYNLKISFVKSVSTQYMCIRMLSITSVPFALPYTAFIIPFNNAATTTHHHCHHRTKEHMWTCLITRTICECPK